MTEILLLDNSKVLSLFDTGSTVNLKSEAVIKSCVYLSSLPIMNCTNFRICNTNEEMVEIYFRLKDNYILNTTDLVVPNFGSVKCLLSISSMNKLNSVIDVASWQISIRKKSFVFRTCFHTKIKAHDSITIPIKCILPKALKNGDFISNFLDHIKLIYY